MIDTSKYDHNKKLSVKQKEVLVWADSELDKLIEAGPSEENEARLRTLDKVKEAVLGR